MGDYTKIVFDAELKDMPHNPAAEFFRILKRADSPSEMSNLIARLEHPFFDKPRWHMLFFGASEYFSTRGFDYWTGYDLDPASVHISSSFKNYSNEINLFLDWITPFVYPEPVYGFVQDEYRDPRFIIYNDAYKKIVLRDIAGDDK
jgi:hypothetical protein